MTWLRRRGQPFDLVFLDPPFADRLLSPSCRLLAEHGWLASGARVYLEGPADAGPPDLPAGWAPAREGRAGQVRFALVETGTEFVDSE
jgi:16S rRNA (guanine966-N2)-methyltransferase